MHRETLAEKSARLATRTGSGAGMPPSPPPAPRPSLLQAQTFLHPEVREAIIDRERKLASSQRERIASYSSSQDEDTGSDREDPEEVFNRLQSLARFGGEDENTPPVTAADLAVSAKAQPSQEAAQVLTVSSHDLELLEMVEAMDPAELLLKGRVSFELDVTPGVLSISVQSLKKSDLRDIQADVDDFRRGKEVDDGSRLAPSMAAIDDFSDMRHLAQGILGMNGKPFPNDWIERFRLLDQLAAPAYAAVRREYIKFLDAVSLLFPDNSTKEQMDKLRSAVKKAQAHP